MDFPVNAATSCPIQASAWAIASINAVIAGTATLKMGAKPAARLFFKYNKEEDRPDNVWFALPEYLARF